MGGLSTDYHPLIAAGPKDWKGNDPLKLQLEKLVENYDKTILNGLNLTIENVQAVGIIGASGCGDCTLVCPVDAIDSYSE